ncbi:MAG TPA: NAD(P)H-hydrate dehydratase [Acidimicrobiales bacterium]|nr:NAD(P)H-hydrate dehydratase [Acidimicrobiales bacterium]
MIPVLTPTEMSGVDRSAPEPVGVLVERAGFAVARAARTLMAGTYGRRVVVVAGPGNNGADGRVAARVLSRWGASVEVLDAVGAARMKILPGCDLVVDAAFGTGLSRAYSPPDPGGARVMAVDIPSGLSGLTGKAVGDGGAVAADATVTFAAYKPGLLLGRGPELAGEVQIAGLGLGALAASSANAWLVTDDDIAASLLPRPRETHKWKSAVQVIAGSPGMPGAAVLVATSAMRAGAGYALVGVPAGPPGGGLPPGEYVASGLPAQGWASEAAKSSERVQALVVGPGLGGARVEVAQLLRATSVPAVVDADGLTGVGSLDEVREVTASRAAAIVLTPHEGEYSRLRGRAVPDDRLEDVRDAARSSGAVVLLKGSTTVVASPDGRVLIAAAGSSRLATAGTGDVLSGVIGAFIARGLPAFEAAAYAAHCHGRAASLGSPEGLVASDLPRLVSFWLSGVVRQ